MEWLFGDIINSFKLNDFKKNLKIFLNNVGKMHVVSVILRNALHFDMFVWKPDFKLF